MKDSKQIFKRLGIIGVGLCAACCMLPMVAVFFGAGLMTFVSSFLEIAGIIAMLSSIILFVIYFMKKRRRAPACDIDCGCKEHEGNKNGIQSLR